jgi:hypothetical protein
MPVSPALNNQAFASVLAVMDVAPCPPLNAPRVAPVPYRLVAIAHLWMPASFGSGPSDGGLNTLSYLHRSRGSKLKGWSLPTRRTASSDFATSERLPDREGNQRYRCATRRLNLSSMRVSSSFIVRSVWWRAAFGGEELSRDVA